MSIYVHKMEILNEPYKSSSYEQKSSPKNKPYSPSLTT